MIFVNCSFQSNQRDFLELVKRNDVERVDRILNGGLDPNFNVIMGGEWKGF